MGITFDDALRIARKSIGDMAGDGNPEVLGFEAQNGFNFRFRTVKGDYAITIDPDGNVGKFNRESAPAYQAPAQPARSQPYTDQRASAPAPHGGLTQQAAVEKALSYVGGGRVEKVKPHHGGWEIEIARGMVKGKVKVQVDANGNVYTEKKSRMEMLDFDFD